MENLNKKLSNANKNLLTIRDIVRFMVSIFNEHKLSFGHGTFNAFDEAIYLVLATLNLPLDQIDPYWDARLLPEEINKLLKICEDRVVEKLPAPYITNEAIYFGFNLYVDKRVIIPRSYIGELITHNKLSEYVEHLELVHNVLDLCTGSGAIAIVAANYYHDSNVIATDIKDTALEVAEINIKKYELWDRIELIESDLFDNLEDYRGKFDIIFTNPPYVDSRRMKSLPDEYLHEPKISLFGGDDGLSVVSKIIETARYYLTNFGVLVLEMGDNQDEIEEKYPGLNLKWLDTQNKDGFVFIITKADLDEYFE